MTRGGKREGSGRKKLGRDIRVKMNEDLISDINIYANGKNQSERIRDCVMTGLKVLKAEGTKTNE